MTAYFYIEIVLSMIMIITKFECGYDHYSIVAFGNARTTL